MTPAIKIEHVSKKYRNRHVIQDISFEIGMGEIYGFIGPNGSGKTTLLKMLAGLVRPDEGSHVEVLGQVYTKDSAQTPEGIGIVLEHSAFIPHVSGRKNLQLLAGIRGVVTDERILCMLQRVGLDPHDSKPVRSYSLGMRQRLGLAQALMEEPRLLLLDEPTNGLDPQGMIEMREIIIELAREQGVAVFITSHMLSEMEKMCDRIGIVQDGVLITELDLKQEQTVSGKRLLDISVTTEQDWVLLEQWGGAVSLKRMPAAKPSGRIEINRPTPDVIRELVQAGISVEAVHPPTNALETMFMDIVAKRGGNKL